MSTDTRFYRRVGSLNAREISGELDGELAGNPACSVQDVASSAGPSAGTLIFVGADEKTNVPDEHEGIIIGPAALRDQVKLRDGSAFIAHSHPKAAFARIAAKLVVPHARMAHTAINPSASIAASAVISAGASIGPGARIGEDCQIGPNAVIGPGVEIGERTQVGACAVIGFALIGRDCRVGPGSVLGEAGFGLVPGPDGLVELPHFGRVVVGDDVRIGANCTIDRGMFGDTRLRSGVKLDNLCHIAHNVDVGEHTLMAAFAGISGSVKIGRGAQFGGRVGIVDHVNIGDGARLAANASPAWDVPAGETWAGQPAQPIRGWLRELAILKRMAAPKRRAVDAGKPSVQDKTDD